MNILRFSKKPLALASFTTVPALPLPCEPPPPPQLTCVSDAVLLTLLPGLIDDAHPDQGRQHDTAHHGDGEDAHSGAVLPAARSGQDAQLAVSTLSAQGVGHLAGVLTRIFHHHVLNDQQLLARGEVVPFAEGQGPVPFEPGDAGGRASSRFALESHRFSHGCHTVLQGHSQGRGFCKKSVEVLRLFCGPQLLYLCLVSWTKENPRHQ